MARCLLLTLGVMFVATTVAFASCSAPQNAIEAENCNPGSPPSQWDVGFGTSGDSTIQGFATDLSVNVGQTVYFKINTTATSYRIDIYRVGYYQGSARYMLLPLKYGAYREPSLRNRWDQG